MTSKALGPVYIVSRSHLLELKRGLAITAAPESQDDGSRPLRLSLRRVAP